MDLIKTFMILGGAAMIALSACSGPADKPIDKSETLNPQPDGAQEGAAPTVSLAEIIANPRREADTPRDEFRHPLKTLEFFEIEPGQSVAEIYPGWYTDVIAPYLKEGGGKYYAVLLPEGINERFDARVAAYKKKYADSDVYGDVAFASFGANTETMLPAGSVDTVLTFRNVHNWMRGGYGDKAFQQFYAALKPGGVLGVVEHRLPESAVQSPKGETGYVQESYMKDMAARAGFEFIASSEINANPLDTADHPMGVWTLPPVSRLPKEGSEIAKGFKAELYKNIGESDRATLKFRKPAESGN